jgi:hypothetical protein
MSTLILHFVLSPFRAFVIKKVATQNTYRENAKVRKHEMSHGLVILEIVVWSFKHDSDIDFQKRLPHGIGLFDKPQIHIQKPSLRADKGGTKFWIGHQRCS